jgi:hypothetical protein
LVALHAKSTRDRTGIDGCSPKQAGHKVGGLTKGGVGQVRTRSSGPVYGVREGDVN